MSPANIIFGLSAIKDHGKKVLESDSALVLEQQIAALKAQAAGKKPTEWGYAFNDPPLRFVPAEQKGYRLTADILCDIRWREEGHPPAHQELVLRIWSDDGRLVFREDFDAKTIQDQVEKNGQRVMLRVHFDCANEGQDGPKHHIQYGGKAKDDELCWFPKLLDLPRLIHQPMDVILLIQLVVKNLYPSQYDEMFRDHVVKSAVRRSETCVLKEYYASCLKTIEGDGDSLLDHLWNSKGRSV